MKKINLHSGPLRLVKKRIMALHEDSQEAIRGGFTYSLSMGQFCRESKGLGANNPYHCGQLKRESELYNCEAQPAPIAEAEPQP
ncbi:hypothetical protein [Taibaiella koreensis]|uniref:hypothetical protein n=1 Tax=Taibaiella koreensis TaxID=1268548 RepID=UPI000E59FB1F|nr:hypothetical protein [Taibaiella koreensis]